MSVDIEEITSLGTRVLDRILKPVYDRIAEVAKRVETLERHVFDQAKASGTGNVATRSASGFVLQPSSLLASAPAEPKPDPEPEPAVVEEEQPSPMPAPQVAGDLEAGDEHEPAA